MIELRVDFNRPVIVGHEMEYMTEAVANGHISGDGLFTKKCHTLLEESLGVKKALLTTSCTHALEMAAILLDIQDGETTRDGLFSLEVQSCIGACGHSPVMAVNGEYHSGISGREVRELINQYREDAGR